MYDYLSPLEHSKTAAVDFDKVIAGDWTRMVIVCTGATHEEVNQALGFAWKDSPPIAPSSHFIAMVVFAKSDEVESYDNIGQDPFIEGEWYFTPCTSKVLEDVETAEPLAVPRAKSTVRFEFDTQGSHPFWSVPLDEFRRLRTLSPVQ